jgi:DNA-directed RNA polymerase subunit K/omega
VTKKTDGMDLSRPITNKYLMACAISKRARQLSEKKGRMPFGDEGSNPIEMAMREISEGKVSIFGMESASPAVAEKEAADNADGLEEKS